MMSLFVSTNRFIKTTAPGPRTKANVLASVITCLFLLAKGLGKVWFSACVFVLAPCSPCAYHPTDMVTYNFLVGLCVVVLASCPVQCLAPVYYNHLTSVDDF
jgi:hypothetical protein